MSGDEKERTVRKPRQALEESNEYEYDRAPQGNDGFSLQLRLRNVLLFRQRESLRLVQGQVLGEWALDRVNEFADRDGWFYKGQAYGQD
jgi:hypothetical protein